MKRLVKKMASIAAAAGISVIPAGNLYSGIEVKSERSNTFAILTVPEQFKAECQSGIVRIIKDADYVYDIPMITLYYGNDGKDIFTTIATKMSPSLNPDVLESKGSIVQAISFTSKPLPPFNFNAEFTYTFFEGTPVVFLQAKLKAEKDDSCKFTEVWSFKSKVPWTCIIPDGKEMLQMGKDNWKTKTIQEKWQWIKFFDEKGSGINVLLSPVDGSFTGLKSEYRIYAYLEKTVKKEENISWGYMVFLTKYEDNTDNIKELQNLYNPLDGTVKTSSVLSKNEQEIKYSIPTKAKGKLPVKLVIEKDKVEKVSAGNTELKYFFCVKTKTLYFVADFQGNDFEFSVK